MRKKHFAAILYVTLCCAGCANTDDVTSDMCPDNPDKLMPGVCGCDVNDVDVNSNTIIDCLEDKVDLCPEDENKKFPGICGCGVSDEDKDGNTIADCLDKDMDLCPDDEDKVAPGVCGCGKKDEDSDGDGVFDCLDQCPENNLLSVKGVCGCGEVTDGDGDEVPGCIDQCDDDPKKVVAGICGCGKEDSPEAVADDDGDGVINCLDECPENPYKSAAGSKGAGCEIADIDRDGVDDKNDACPYNPGITESGKDCNYVTDADGKKVFEIWSVYDLKRLSEESMLHAPQGKVGMICDRNSEVSHCYDAGKSSIKVNCSTSVTTYFYKWAKSSEDTTKVCVETEEGAKLEEYACTEKTGETYEVGNCCAPGEFASICQADEGTLLSCDDKTGSVQVMPCAYGCTESDGKGECKACNGEVLANGGHAGDCCDSDKYAPNCSSEGTLLKCNSGIIVEEACAVGCVPATSDEVVAECEACHGEDVSVGGNVNDCCDVNHYASSCNEDGTLLSCEGGVVKKVECMGGCQTYTRDLKIWCQRAPEVDASEVLYARVMSDLDFAEAVKAEEGDLGCSGYWTAVNLYNVELDGKGKTWKFSAREGRCGLAGSIFGVVENSKLSNLTFDLDVLGGVGGLVSRYASHSHYDNINWSGNYINTHSKYGFDYYYNGILSYAALESAFSNISIQGNIQNMGGYFGGLVSQMEKSLVSGVHAELDTVDVMKLGYSLISENFVSSLVKTVEQSINRIRLNQSANYYGVAHSANNSYGDGIKSEIKTINDELNKTGNVYMVGYSWLDLHDLSLKVDKGWSSYFYGTVYSATNISDVTIDYGTIDTSSISYGICNSCKVEGLDAKIHELRSQSNIYGGGYNFGGSKLNIDIDKLESKSAGYGIANYQRSKIDSMNLRIGSMNSTGSNAYGIVYSTNGYSIFNSSVQIDELIGNYAYLIYQLNTSGETLKNLSVYANMYTINDGGNYRTLSLISTLSNSPILRNLAIALRQSRFSKRDGFGKPSDANGVTDFSVVIGDKSSSGKTLNTSNVYWLKRTTETGAYFATYADKLKPYLSENVTATVEALNVATGDAKWGVKTIDEDGTSISIPWYQTGVEATSSATAGDN